jgi:hypothetical protein
MDKKLRVCPVNRKLSLCDGVCEVAVDSHDKGEAVLRICPVRSEALDNVLNG